MTDVKQQGAMTPEQEAGFSPSGQMSEDPFAEAAKNDAAAGLTPAASGQMQQQAMDAVAAEQPVSPPEDPVEDTDIPPEDPVQRLRWVALKLKQINPNSPSESTLLQWKQMHGSIFVLNISEFTFIYRYIKRQEWTQMLTPSGLNAQTSFHQLDEKAQNEKLVQRCLLWPRMEPMLEASLPAGAVDMIADQIRLESMFLNPQAVANLTLRL